MIRPCLATKQEICMCTFRPFKSADYQQVARLIATTWEFDSYCSPDVARYLSYVYLDACLIEQNFTQVVEVAGKIAGVIFAQSAKEHHPSLLAQVRHKWHLALLQRTFEGRLVLNFFERIDVVDERLLRNTHHSYQGKVELFIVDSSYQGLGLGKKLFRAALAFFAQRQVSDFYLFTDSSCNVGFYQHAGLSCRGHYPFYYQEQGSKQCLDMYIYDRRSLLL